MRKRILCIIVALDILLFAIMTLGGSKRNETISSAAWSMEQDGKLLGLIFRPAIDWFLSWLEDDHCCKSWRIEQR